MYSVLCSKPLLSSVPDDTDVTVLFAPSRRASEDFPKSVLPSLSLVLCGVVGRPRFTAPGARGAAHEGFQSSSVHRLADARPSKHKCVLPAQHPWAVQPALGERTQMSHLITMRTKIGMHPTSWRMTTLNRSGAQTSWTKGPNLVG